MGLRGLAEGGARALGAGRLAQAARLAGALGAAAETVTGVGAPAEAGAAHLARGRFDRCVDALNRLPRPLFALGALGFFGYGLADPAGFARRMEALSATPEPLWWLLGAVVSFHFGAREAHHFRSRTAPPPPPAPPAATRPAAGG